MATSDDATDDDSDAHGDAHTLCYAAMSTYARAR